MTSSPGEIDPAERLTILETMRELTQITLRASSRESLERQVCEAFVASDLYVFAWVGAEDPATQQVEPRASAGGGEDYLAEIDITVGSPETGVGPTGRAIESREVQVVQNIAENPAFAPWREPALERGYRSSAGVPLVFGDTLYGVLSIYADRPEAFEPYERALLSELGQDIAHAIDVLETRTSLARSHDFLARTEELAAAGGWELQAATGEFRWTEGARRIHGATDDGSPTLEAALEDYHPSDRDALADAIDGAVDEGQPFDLTLRMPTDRRADPRWIRVIGRPTTDRNGEVIVRGVIQDVTDRKIREDRLEIRNEQLLLINRIVRHDIRNDMGIVLGWGGELDAHVDDEGDVILDRVLETGQHVVDITHALQDFIKALETEGRFARTAADLGEVLTEEVEKRRAAYPEATFTIEGPTDETWVWADELLSSVFRNLLDNAVIHNDDPEPQVRVSVEHDGGTVRVSVADNGPGIPVEHREAILGRAEGGLEHPMAGLGLYLVDLLVSNYGGDVRIEDNDPRGAVFVVELDRFVDGSGRPRMGRTADTDR